MMSECGWSSFFPVRDLSWKSRGVERRNGGELAQYHGEVRMAGWRLPDAGRSKCVSVTVTRARFNLQWED